MHSISPRTLADIQPEEGGGSNSDSAKTSKDRKSIDGRKRKNPRVDSKEYIDATDEVYSHTTADPNTTEGISSMAPMPRKKEILPLRHGAWEIYIPN